MAAMNWMRLLLLCLGLLPWSAAPSADGIGDEVVTPNMRTGLVSEYAVVTPGQSFMVGMRQRIRPHWHTYWQNPGDTGEPTDLAWQLPGGWSVSEILWPAPSRIPVGPLMNFGYSDEVMLLSEVVAPLDAEPGDTHTLVADAYWLVCEEVCIPEEGRLRVTVGVGSEPVDGAGKSLIDTARTLLPRSLPWRAGAALEEGMLTLSLPLGGAGGVTSAAYFPRQRDVIENAAEQSVMVTDTGLSLRVATGFAASRDSLDGLLVLTDNLAGTAIRSAYHVVAGELIMDSVLPVIPAFWQVLLMALAGGLILNLMPCVFPVLSIKVLSLLGARTADAGGTAGRGALLRHGMIYALGVVTGFLMLALLLLALRQAGQAAGWGFHLQNPVLVLLLVWLFFLIGLNLSGFFEIGGRLSGLGQGLLQGHGYLRAFATGLLATVVATPCTAPFMGVAMGYALVQPWATALTVFAVLGVGMALPLVTLVLLPGLLQRLPRPGPWMLRFRELLAFPMYASAVWLLWVLVRQSGPEAILPAAGGAVVIALAIWLARTAGPRWKSVGVVAGMGLLGGSLYLLNQDGSGFQDEPDDGWLAWNPALEAESRAAGPVFVNFTADWCITCKANELVALDTERVRRAFVERGVTRLKADWTRRDGVIARALETHGRSGVPLYLWYPDPSVGRPEILPQLLTEGLLLERLERLAAAPNGVDSVTTLETQPGDKI